MELHVLLRHRLLRQAHGFEGFVSVVEVVDPRDQAAAYPVDERVRAVDLDAAAAPLCLHPNKDHYRVAGVDELVQLDAPLSPRFSPVLKPPRQAVVSAVVALVGGVVVMNLDLGISRVPENLARRDQMSQHSLNKLHDLL